MEQWASKTVAACAGCVVIIHSMLTPHTDPIAENDQVTTSVVELESQFHSQNDECQLWVPRGCSVLIGSLDRSAGRHELSVCWNPVSNSSESPQSKTPDDWDIATVALDPPCPATATPIPRSTNIEYAADSDVPCLPADASVVRRFSIPRFTTTGAFNRHLCGRIVACGATARVFLIDGDAHADAVSSLARQVVGLVEGKLRRCVEQHLVPIVDVDQDGYLTFVIARLAAENRSRNDEPPITGCVRATDFLNSESDFGGDIVYLDISLPSGRELEAVLTHELAHASVFSAIRKNRECDIDHSMPCWLNEAIAHYMEDLVCPDSDNLRSRLRQFACQPHAFPVVIPDNSERRSISRGPTRAAAYLFLKATMADMPPTALRELLLCSCEGTLALEHMTGQRFDKMFRDWGVGLAREHGGIHEMKLSAGNETRCILAGTAVSCIAPAKTHGRLVISAPPESQLQVTIIQPAADIQRTASSQSQQGTTAAIR